MEAPASLSVAGRDRGGSPQARDHAARTQGMALRSLAPILYTSRILGMAPCRLLPPTTHFEASVVPSPWWAAYSAVVVVAVVVSMARLVYTWVNDSCKVRIDGTVMMVQAVLVGLFFLKQAVAALIFVCAIVKGGEVARVVEKLVRISGRAVLSLGPGLHDGASRCAPRWGAARYGVAAQVLLLLTYWAVVLYLAYTDNPVSYMDMSSLPPIVFVNVQFTDVALLLRAELAMLNDSLAAALEQRPGSPAQDISWVGASSKDRVRGVVQTARALVRELRHSCGLLDDAFGLQTLMFVTMTFVQSTVVLYMLLIEGMLIDLWLAGSALHLLQLYAQFAACQQVKDEALRTAGVVHRALLRPDLSDAAQQELVDFSVQLATSAEMTFSAWGLFTLDHGTMMSFLGTVATYIVIMVQFRGPRKPLTTGLFPGANSTSTTTTTTTTTASPTT